MKLKFLLKLLLLITLVLLLNNAFARGGGASGGGGGGGSRGSSGTGGRFYGYTGVNGGSHGNGNVLYTFIIVAALIAIGVLAVMIPSLLEFKSKLAQKILTHAAQKDTLWEARKLKLHANKTFDRIQTAWQNRDADLIKKIITPELHALYKRMLDEMKDRGEKNVLSDILIFETTIIGCQDYLDDSKDRYIAYIKGSMLDYILHLPTNRILINPDKTIERFTDTYHFVRSNNSWLLEKIDNNPSDLDILKVKNHMEA